MSSANSVTMSIPPYPCLIAVLSANPETTTCLFLHHFVVVFDVWFLSLQQRALLPFCLTFYHVLCRKCILRNIVSLLRPRPELFVVHARRSAGTCSSNMSGVHARQCKRSPCKHVVHARPCKHHISTTVGGRQRKLREWFWLGNAGSVPKIGN